MPKTETHYRVWLVVVPREPLSDMQAKQVELMLTNTLQSPGIDYRGRLNVALRVYCDTPEHALRKATLMLDKALAYYRIERRTHVFRSEIMRLEDWQQWAAEGFAA